jgi:hypothetical protein
MQGVILEAKVQSWVAVQTSCGHPAAASAAAAACMLLLLRRQLHHAGEGTDRTRKQCFAEKFQFICRSIFEFFREYP